MRDYFDDVYAEFWKEQSVKYGIDKFCQYELNSIIQQHPKSVFEVGIGTGWPFAYSLKEKGINVEGCDVSAKMVEVAKEKLKTENIYVGDVCSLDIEKKYDVVYCLRVSWCIPKFDMHLKKMLDLLEGGGDGVLIFDFMNLDTVMAKKDLLIWWIKCFPKRLIKNLLNIPTSAPPINCFYSKRKIEKFLIANGVQIVAMECEDKATDFKWVFCCKKQLEI